MLAKIRRRTAFYQLAVILLFMSGVFVFSAVYNYDVMNNQVQDRLSEIQEYGGFPLSEKRSDRVFGRDFLVIRVAQNGKYLVSDMSMYDEETVQKIVYKTKEGSGRFELKGRRLAYVTVNNGGDAFYTVYVCDYTAAYEGYVSNLLSISLSAIGVLAVVAFFVFRFTNRNLQPIESAIEKQKELIANASHELKTPLTIINTDLSILTSSEGLTEEHKKWLGGIQTQVNRMSAMINEMLLLARFEATKSGLQKVNLTTIVESVTLETEALAFEKNVHLETEIAQDAFVNGRKDDLEKLTYILMDNAMKYTEPKGRIDVKLIKERHRVTLKVKNTGEGIPQDVIPKLFDRFYRVDEAHSTPGSFGLGLSIAKAIVDSVGATIGVNSQPGEYAEFVVVFKEATK